MRARQLILGVAAAVGVASLTIPSGTSANPGEPDTTESATTTEVPDVEGLDDTLAPAETPAPPARVEGDTADRGSSPIQLTPTQPPPPPTTTIPPTLPPPPPDALPWFSGTGRRVVYSISAMRVWAVEADGTVVKTHRVSGKRGMPYPGTYNVWSRSLHTHSLDNPQIRWMYMIRFAKTPSGGNIGFHEIPTECRTWTSNTTGRDCRKLQTEAQLGRALSGGCVRQSTPDAIWMWNWAGIGTRVVVLA